MARPGVREKLVGAAVHAFHERGFNGCSIQNITDAAGVPKGSFFNHFQTKESLALEALERYGAGSRMDLLFDHTVAPLQRLKSHFAYLAESYASFNFERGCLLGNLGSEMARAHPQMREALRGMFDAWSGAVAAVLREAQSSGQIDASLNPDQLAHFLVNAWEGVAMRLKIVRRRGPVDEFFSVCFDVLLKPSSQPA